MRIAICDYCGHPFQVQLSRQLAKRGHNVLHLYSTDIVGPKGAVQRLASDVNNFEIEGVTTGEPVSRLNFVKRRRQESQIGRLFARRCELFRPDIIISANMPLDAQSKLMAAARRINASFIFWLQDVISVAMEKLLSQRSFVYRPVIMLYRLREKRLLRQSDAVVAISDDFVPILKQWRIANRRTWVIPNWAPLEDIPVAQKVNAWSRRLGLGNKRLILYAGTLGLKHNPNKLLDIAAAAAPYRDVRIVVASEGAGAEFISNEVKRRRLENLSVLPFQPIDEFPAMLAAADVLVVLIEKEAGTFSVPSKLLSYLCAGRAVLLSVPKENLAARIVEQNELGIVVDPDDNAQFVASALRLLDDEKARAQYAYAARRYAEETFDIERIADRFEEVIASATGRSRAQGRAAPDYVAGKGRLASRADREMSDSAA